MLEEQAAMGAVVRERLIPLVLLHLELQTQAVAAAVAAMLAEILMG
tara:strand:- start:325 stop:462 length:138 start_codon:yes stop_codon:yes gene_type:complete